MTKMNPYEQMISSVNKIYHKQTTELPSGVPIHNNMLNLEWNNLLAIQRVYEMIQVLNRNPDMLGTKKGQSAIWYDVGSYHKVEIQDQAYQHTKPERHSDFIFVWLRIQMKPEKVADINKITSAAFYYEPGQLLCASGNFLGESIATFSVLKEYNDCKINLEEARELLNYRVKELTEEFVKAERSGNLKNYPTPLMDALESYVISDSLPKEIFEVPSSLPSLPSLPLSPSLPPLSLSPMPTMPPSPPLRRPQTLDNLKEDIAVVNIKEINTNNRDTNNRVSSDRIPSPPLVGPERPERSEYEPNRPEPRRSQISEYEIYGGPNRPEYERQEPTRPESRRQEPTRPEPRRSPISEYEIYGEPMSPGPFPSVSGSYDFPPLSREEELPYPFPPARPSSTRSSLTVPVPSRPAPPAVPPTVPSYSSPILPTPGSPSPGPTRISRRESSRTSMRSLPQLTPPDVPSRGPTESKYILPGV